MVGNLIPDSVTSKSILRFSVALKLGLRRHIHKYSWEHQRLFASQEISRLYIRSANKRNDSVATRYAGYHL